MSGACFERGRVMDGVTDEFADPRRLELLTVDSLRAESFWFRRARANHRAPLRASRQVLAT
jgi:esterase/lipase superfamily enzyme